MKLGVFLLIMSVLDIVREVLRLFVSFSKNEPFEITPLRLGMLWCAISYTITVIFCGFIE